jgi:hypothetical protein
MVHVASLIPPGDPLSRSSGWSCLRPRPRAWWRHPPHRPAAILSYITVWGGGRWFIGGNHWQRRGRLHVWERACVVFSPVSTWVQSHSAHRVATAALWRTFSHEGKISPGWWGWGEHAHPLSLHLPSPVKLQCTLQLSGQTHLPCFISSKNMYSVGTIFSLYRMPSIQYTCPKYMTENVMNPVQYSEKACQQSLNTRLHILLLQRDFI